MHIQTVVFGDGDRECCGRSQLGAPAHQVLPRLGAALACAGMAVVTHGARSNLASGGSRRARAAARHVVTHRFLGTHDGYGFRVIERGALAFRYRGEEVVAPAGAINLVIPDEPHTGQAAAEAGCAPT
jgi:hypothetical protein